MATRNKTHLLHSMIKIIILFLLIILCIISISFTFYIAYDIISISGYGEVFFNDILLNILIFCSYLLTISCVISVSANAFKKLIHTYF